MRKKSVMLVKPRTSISLILEAFLLRANVAIVSASSSAFIDIESEVVGKIKRQCPNYSGTVLEMKNLLQ